MVKSHKLIIALLIVSISAIAIPVLAQEMCDKCKANPENCKLTVGEKCEDPEGCQDIAKMEGDNKTVEKKIIVLTPDENRGFLGVYAETKDGGVVVEKVVPESPADKAGIVDGMVITVIKGNKVKTKEELINVLKDTKPEDTVSVVVKSDGKEKTLKVVLAKVPKTEAKEMKIKIKCDECEDEDIEMPMMSMMMPEMTCPKCGHKMQMEMPKMKMKMKTIPEMPEMPMMPRPAEMRGFIGVVTEEDDGQLVIEQVVTGSPAENAGLKEDDIISSINDVLVTTPTELVEVLKTTHPGDVAHLKIMSGGTEKMVDVVLGTPPQPKMPQMKMKIGGRRAKHGRGAGYFGPGFSMFNYDDLNSMFALHSLGQVEEEQFVFSGGGWGQVGRVRLGGFGMGGSQNISNADVNVEVGYGAGFFELGYSVVNAKHFMFTPLLGIGGGGLSLKITALDNPTNLDSLLCYPGGVAKVSKGGLVMYPGLAIDIPFGVAGISLKGGYMWSPMTSAWTMEEFGNVYGPDIKLNGPFITLGIMFGGGK
jgi:membrane-associated protease RseP (regulator of RpoE activity)